MSEGEIPNRDVVDRDACMGSGNCVFWAPDVFDLDDDGIAVVVGDPTGRDEEVRKAAANCPTSAIRIERLLPSSR
jgi:ferredoxin